MVDTRVVIIGGGIMGVSLAYHLGLEGWTDVVLVEKGELTSGSTWHAAGQITHSVSSYGLSVMNGYGIELYQRLEALRIDIGNFAKPAAECAAQLVDDLSKMAARETTAKTKRQVAERLTENVQRPARCFLTGLPRFDNALGGGLYQGRCYGITARKKVGKTLLLGSVSHNLNAAGVKHLFANPNLFLVLIPVQIYNFIETMNNVESAEAKGDKYPVGTCMAFDGAGTVLAALFGSPFPTTVYIGHPGYKRIHARAGYTVGVGIVLTLASMFGLLAFLSNVIPLAATAPILVYIAMTLISESAAAVPKAHIMAIAAAMMDHRRALCLNQQIMAHARQAEIVGELGTGIPRPRRRRQHLHHYHRTRHDDRLIG